ncbi:Regulator of chromosome condensation [Aphelenchoides besseyi]|nr:Regulator of chromosome condensation [Aphelenchoides besseyi]
MAPRVGKKRRLSQSSTDNQSQSQEIPSKKGRRSVSGNRRIKFHLSAEDLSPTVECDRVLTCGTGEQLGHPGRQSTRKPRAIDTLDDDVKLVEACAGGVHSLLLASDGRVFSCGVNEKGTVPVKGLEAEGITDELAEIEFTEEIRERGKILQIAAGASFSAALISDGSVVAWGNLRDSQGDVTAHSHLMKMQRSPVIIHEPKEIRVVKIAAGENHLVMLSSDGEIMTFGEGSMGQLGRSTRSSLIRGNYMADVTGKKLVTKVMEKMKEVKFVDIFAGGYWTVGRAEDNRLFACGLNNYAQLGLPVPISEKAEENGNAASQVDEEDYRIQKFSHVRAFDKDTKWTHIAGVQHLALRNENGEVYTIGKNTDNILGLGTWTGREDNEHWRYDTLQQVIFPEGVKIAGVHASLGTTIAWTEDGDAYAFGFDGAGQLGLGIPEDGEKVVGTPRKIQSAHLNDYAIRSATIADQHTIFLAVKRA